MSDQENLDLGRVVGLIMENPALIEQISALAKQHSENEDKSEKKENVEEAVTKETKEVHAQPKITKSDIGQSNRTRLLYALKPYVSKERAKAIDSMISIVDILDVMKGR